MGVKIQTLRDFRSYIARELNGIYAEPEIKALATILIKTLPEVKKLHQVYNSDQIISADHLPGIKSMVKELKTGRPLQYILGKTDFYNCTIKVTESTLIPRQETEELVDLVIRENQGFKGRIIDFGTGSGCIAIALAKNLPDAAVTGVDISGEAIIVARENAMENNVSVEFCQGDLFRLDYVLTLKAGIIVSNPPYVRLSEKRMMKRNVLEFEPHTALFVNDSEPLVFYKSILETAKSILLPEGMVYFEINESMGQEMADLLGSFRYSEIKLFRDINGKERIIKGRRNG